MAMFQASATAQGRHFADQCNLLLQNHAYQLHGKLLLPDIGVEIDQEAISPRGTRVWFEYKGTIQGIRPGLLRTDTLKKAIANGALMRAVDEHPPYVLLCSHLPTVGSGLAMLQAANRLGYFADVICVYDPPQLARLSNF
jgi:hypothetical protein